jgi:Ca-activated chloride channel family protein
MKTRWIRALSIAACAAAMFPITPAFAQDVPDDEQDANIVVTGMRVRQGGAQDISHFRAIADNEGMPRPESLTVEGLYGEHDLTLPASSRCAKLFCVVSESMPAALAGRADDKLFVGLGFTSNIDADKWRRPPLNLVAVVDKSGSMDGEPLDLVRASLLKIVGQMRDGDRISIVLYGETSHVYLAPTNVRGNRERIESMIRGIESGGSTNMEEGLQVGYDTAFADAPKFKGSTRVMLFTDEQPNVGNTDAGSFIGMAQAASQRGIGLTTIGVGVQFDASLATQVSSTRGGNLFFIADKAQVVSVFDRQLDTMVSELAHDLTLTLRPAPGYRISGVFGVPDGVMEEAEEGVITITVPTVFLSANGGGIFVTMAKASDRADLPLAPIAAGQPVLAATASWSELDGRPGNDQIAVMPPAGRPSVPMRTAYMLTDQYLGMRDATTAFHAGDPKAAYAILAALSGRMKGSGLPGMAPEVKLVGDLTDRAGFYSGYGGEPPRSLRHVAVVGRWRVVSATGFDDVKRGDEFEFTEDREFSTYRKATGFDTPDDTEDYEINNDSIHLVNSNMVLQYAAKGDSMIMTLDQPITPGRIALRRVE